MDKEWEKKANIAAAQVLGWGHDGAKLFVSTGRFTIFGDSIGAKATRDDVVQELIRKCTYIYKTVGGRVGITDTAHRFDAYGDDLAEAIGYACIAVIDGGGQ